MSFFDKPCECDLVTVRGEEKFYGGHECPNWGWGKLPMVVLFIIGMIHSIFIPVGLIAYLLSVAISFSFMVVIFYIIKWIGDFQNWLFWRNHK